jgi:carbonic anhydrase
VQELIQGIHRFQSQVFAARRGQFERLARGQQPQALFITCSDSRIDPGLMTQTEPGDLFVLRNAGNIIPPHGAGTGEAATIEFAVDGLGVRDVIVCGHSHCGAIRGLLDPREVAGLPAVARWLELAEATRRIVRESYGHLDGDQLVSAAVQENVLVQVEHLGTLPAVAARLARGELRLHAWVYEIESGEVLAYDAELGQFLPLRPGHRIPTVEPSARGRHRDPGEGSRTSRREAPGAPPGARGARLAGVATGDGRHTDG